MEQKPWQRRGPKIMPLEKRLMLDASLPALTGQVLWLDAADATSVRDADGDNAATGTGGSNNGFGGTVATWVDKSGSGFNVTSSVANERPSYGVNTQNSRNVITFDGTTDKLINTTATIAGDDFTSFVVYNRTTGTARDAIYEIGNGGSRNALFINEGGSNKPTYYFNGTFYNYSSNYTPSTYSLSTIIHNTNAINAWTNAGSQVATTGGTRVATTGIYVGDDSSSGDQLQGHIAEMIIYDRDLSADERHDVENYLAAKWGLTVTNTAPALTANAGATTLQGTAVTITSAMLTSNDIDNSESILQYKLTDLSDYGSLTNTSTAHTYALGEYFTQADIAAGYIRYTHNNSANYADSFSFTVSDQASTTAASTFNLTITPSNIAPTIQGWTQVYAENFESGATGWSDNLTETSTPYLTRFLGRHSGEAGVQNTFKTYAMTGTQDYTVITFDMYKIDSWDGESFRVFINDSQVINIPLIQNTFNAPVDGTSGAVSYTIQELTPFLTSYAYATNFNDQTFRFTLTVTNAAAANLKIGFSSTLDQAVADEAWGVDNLTIYEAKNGGVPGPIGIIENSPNATVVGRVTARDPDVGQTIAYSIVGGTGASVFSINASTGIITVANSAALNYESVTSYTLDVRATDNGTPSYFDQETVTINVLDLPENTAPSIAALGPLSVAENAANNTVIGTAIGSDAELNTITYSITAGNLDSIFAINAATGAIRVNSNTNLNYDFRTTYTLTIQAQDNGFGNLTGTRNVVVNITNVNEAPTFNIPQSFLNQNPYLRYNAATGNFYQYAATAANYTTATSTAAGTLLNGVAGHLATVTSAAENTYVRGLGANGLWLGGSDAVTEGTWVWAGSGPEAGQVFSSGSVAQNGFYTNWQAGQPDNASNEDHLEMQASGIWNDALTTVAKNYVIEWEGAAVIAALGNGPFTLAENPALNQAVGTVHARDADAGDTLAYSITGGTGAAYFAVNASTGQITVTNPAAINYEAATSYTLNLQAQDAGGLTGTQTVTITITDVNETPVLDLNTGATINEGAAVVITNAMLKSSDVDAPPDSTLIYTITDAIDNGALVNTSTALTLGLGATFTQGDIDSGYIRYTHNGGETTADAFSFTVTDGAITLPAATFVVTVNPVNDAPVIQGWTLVSSENFESGASGWAVNATETSAPFFTQFLGRGSNDGNAQTNFKTYTLSGTQDQAVIMLDFYEIDSWDNETFNIYINDALAINQAYSWAATDNPAGGTNGAVSWTVQKLTPFSTNLGFTSTADQIYRYTITVNTNGANVKLGFGSNLNEGAANEAWGVDNIRVYEVANGGAPTPMELAEATTNGFLVGTVRATDAENGTLNYSITGGSGAAIFSINAATGAITVANAGAIDYESVTSYTLTVQVADNGAPVLTDSETITINILNTPENTAPTITAFGPYSVAENVANNTVVGTVVATDAEGNMLSYAITGGNTDNLFSINSAGQIRIANNNFLNYEYMNAYALTVQVTDNGFGALADTRSVTINITNINEAPNFDAVQRVLAADPALRYNAATGSFYKFITTAASFSAAQSNAAASLLNGVAGYVTNINSALENAYVTSLITTSAWIGGSDSAVEGEWRYLAGPETGTLFWLGAAAGSAQGGNYTNWNGGEPNNSGNEDSIELRTNGIWNDINSGTPHPYVIEWNAAAVIAGLANGPYSIDENSSIGSVVGTAVAGDPDAGDTIAYSITGGTGAGVFSINTATGQITLLSAVNFESINSYTLNLRAQDAGGLFDTLAITVNINDINETPVLDINTGMTLNEGASMALTSAMLSSSDVDTPSDALLVYTLTDQTDNGILFNTATNRSILAGQTFTQGDVDNGRIRYIHNDGETVSDGFSFTVSDGLITLPAATFSMVVTPVNEAPNFDAVQALLDADSALRYDATTGHFYKYMPYFTDFAAAQSLANAATLNGVGGYVAQSNSVYENALIASMINTPSWLGGSDAGMEGTWVYTGGAEAGASFWLGTAGGSAQNGNYTNWNSGEPNQSGNEDNIQIYTNGLWNDAPANTIMPFIIEWDGASVLAGTANGPYAINENSAPGSVVGNAIAHDYDAGEVLTYSITGGTGAGVFTLNASTGQIILNSPVNRELIASYTLDLRVQDSGGLFDTLSITVAINDINDVPYDLALSYNRITENSGVGTSIGFLSTGDEDPSDTHIYTMLVNPGSKFILVGNELRTGGAIDFEQNQTFTITLRTDDGNGGTLDRNFIIYVNDLLDTFTPPPSASGRGNFDAYIPAADDAPPRSIDIVRNSLSDGFAGFYGNQILRENITFQIRDLMLQAGDSGFGLEEEIADFMMDRMFEAGGAFQNDELIGMAGPGFTNLRQALTFLQQMADSADNSDMEAADQSDQQRAAQLPQNAIDRQFVDVMTYHQERAAQLRAALMG